MSKVGNYGLIILTIRFGSKKLVYHWYVVFREEKEVPRQEVNPIKMEPEKIEFELEGEKYDSTGEVE